MQDDKRAESYEKIMQYQRGLHEKNQMRIKIGIKLVIIIPLIFLIVMFKQDSSKVIFLILWIVSLFAISAYLIAVEYMDYQVQIKLNEWGISENDEIRNLLTDDSKMEQIIRSSGILEALPQLEPVQDNSTPDNIAPVNTVQSNLTPDNIAPENTVQNDLTQDSRVQVDSKQNNLHKSEKVEIVKPDIIPQSDEIIPVINSSDMTSQDFMTQTEGMELDTAEEELVQSIRKYVHALSVQTVRQNTIQMKTPQDYAQMRREKARAQALDKQNSDMRRNED